MSIDSMATIARIQGTFEALKAPTTGPGTAASTAAFAKLLASLRTTTPTGTATSGSATGDGIVAAAAKYEGVPYVFGGTSNEGLDCTGLVQKALGDAGIKVGRSMDEQMTAGTEVGKLSDAKPGDLIVLDGGAHIVIYSGNGNVIHAPFEGRTVTEQKMWFDQSDVVTIRRVAPQAAAPVATAPASASSASSADALQSLINAQASILSRSIS